MPSCSLYPICSTPPPSFHTCTASWCAYLVLLQLHHQPGVHPLALLPRAPRQLRGVPRHLRLQVLPEEEQQRGEGAPGGGPGSSSAVCAGSGGATAAEGASGGRGGGGWWLCTRVCCCFCWVGLVKYPVLNRNSSISA